MSVTREASSDNHFTASFSVNLKTRLEFQEWKKEFEEKTHTQYTIRSTRHCKGEEVTFKQYLKCLHNVRKGKIGVRKHTACPAGLTVTIFSQSKCLKHEGQEKTSRCQIGLMWTHNHPIVAADVIRRHRVSSATDQKLIHLYKHGHSPSSALQYIRTEIEDDLPDAGRLDIALANRSICPDDQHCHYIFRKLFSREYGDPNDNANLIEFVKNINMELNELCVIQEDYGTKALVAICTPFMKRVHENIEESAELMFVDSSGGFDRDGFRIFILLTHCKAGGNCYVYYSLLPNVCSECNF